MIIFLVSLIIVFTTIILAFNHPYLSLLFWGIFGSRYDAAGIVGFFDLHFKYYSFFMDMALLIILIISIWRYYKLKKSSFNMYIFSSLLLIFWIFISVIITAINLKVRISSNVVYAIVNFSPTVMLIWFLNYDYYLKRNRKTENYIVIYIFIQIIIAFLIVYLPEININIFNKLSGSNYISDGYIYNKNIFYLTDIMTSLQRKYVFNGLGQFHNANDMGFYGAVGIICSIYAIKKYRMWNKIISIFVLIFSILLWGNSGMRGPIIGIFIGVIVYTIFLKKNLKNFLLIVTLTAIAIVILAKNNELISKILTYLFPNSNNISFVSRKLLRLEGLKYMAKNPIIGSGGLLEHLTTKGIDPHELSLRIACLFGIPASIIITFLLYILPVLEFLKSNNKKFISILFYSIVVMVSLTNNYTDICLFWLLFSGSICVLKVKYNKTEYTSM